MDFSVMNAVKLRTSNHWPPDTHGDKSDKPLAAAKVFLPLAARL